MNAGRHRRPAAGRERAGDHRGDGRLGLLRAPAVRRLPRLHLSRQRCSRCRYRAGPAPATVTVLGGGYLASGVGGRDRMPRPYLPQGLELDGFEGTGEVQTPLHGARRRAPAPRRPRVLPPRQGGRAVRALRPPVSARGVARSWRSCPPTAARARASCELEQLDRRPDLHAGRAGRAPQPARSSSRWSPARPQMGAR